MEHKYYWAGLENGKKIYDKCIELAKNSDCKKRKFGCIIAAKEIAIMAPGEPDIISVWGEGYNHKVCGLENFNCCKERANSASGTRTEYCGAIHAETMALQDLIRHAHDASNFSNITLYVAGLNGDGSFFDNSKGFYCLPCAKELIHAGIPKIALASLETPKTGVWSMRTINKAVSESLKFTKGTKKVDYDANFGR